VILKPQNHVILGYPKVIPYTKFEHFGIIRFWVMLRTCVKNAFIDPVILTFDLWTPKVISFLGYPKIIFYIKCEFHFWVMVRTNKQTWTSYPSRLTLYLLCLCTVRFTHFCKVLLVGRHHSKFCDDDDDGIQYLIKYKKKKFIQRCELKQTELESSQWIESTANKRNVWSECLRTA